MQNAKCKIQNWSGRAVLIASAAARTLWRDKLRAGSLTIENGHGARGSGHGAIANWKHPERRGADVEISGTLSGTESTLFRIFPHISAYFRITREKNSVGLPWACPKGTDRWDEGGRRSRSVLECGGAPPLFKRCRPTQSAPEDWRSPFFRRWRKEVS